MGAENRGNQALFPMAMAHGPGSSEDPVALQGIVESQGHDQLDGQPTYLVIYTEDLRHERGRLGFQENTAQHHRYKLPYLPPDRTVDFLERPISI